MKGRIQRVKPEGKLILPRAGFIKTGFKDNSGIPKSVDYFIPAGRYAEYFNKEYPNKPQVIQVLFLSDDPMDSCEERFEYRDKEGRLFAFGDGINFEYWDKNQYQKTDIEKMPDMQERIAKNIPSNRGWEVILTLRFLIPKIKGIAGYWQFTTRGANSTIPNIVATFDSVAENRGFVKGVIFDLTVEFAKSQKPGSKSRYPVVNLIPNVSEENIKMVKQAFLQTDTNKLLNDTIQDEGQTGEVQ